MTLTTAAIRSVALANTSVVAPMSISVTVLTNTSAAARMSISASQRSMSGAVAATVKRGGMANSKAIPVEVATVDARDIALAAATAASSSMALEACPAALKVRVAMDARAATSMVSAGRSMALDISRAGMGAVVVTMDMRGGIK